MGIIKIQDAAGNKAILTTNSDITIEADKDNKGAFMMATAKITSFDASSVIETDEVKQVMDPIPAVDEETTTTDTTDSEQAPDQQQEEKQ